MIMAPSQERNMIGRRRAFLFHKLTSGFTFNKVLCANDEKLTASMLQQLGVQDHDEGVFQA